MCGRVEQNHASSHSLCPVNPESSQLDYYLTQIDLRVWGLTHVAELCQMPKRNQ